MGTNDAGYRSRYKDDPPTIHEATNHHDRPVNRKAAQFENRFGRFPHKTKIVPGNPQILCTGTALCRVLLDLPVFFQMVVSQNVPIHVGQNYRSADDKHAPVSGRLHAEHDEIASSPFSTARAWTAPDIRGCAAIKILSQSAILRDRRPFRRNPGRRTSQERSSHRPFTRIFATAPTGYWRMLGHPLLRIPPQPPATRTHTSHRRGSSPPRAPPSCVALAGARDVRRFTADCGLHRPTPESWSG